MTNFDNNNVALDEKISENKMKINKNFSTERAVDIMKRYNEGKELFNTYADVIKDILGVTKLTPVVLKGDNCPADRLDEFKAALKEYNRGADLIAQAKTDMTSYMDKYILDVINKKFGTYTKHFADLRQEGMIGVLKSMDKYDPTISRPSTFFRIYIIHEMTEYINRVVNKTSPHYSENIVKIKRLLSKNEYMGRVVSCIEISQETGVSPETVVQAVKIYNAANEVHIDAAGLEGKMADYGETPEDKYLKKESNELLYNEMEKTLSKEEYLVVAMRHGLGGYDDVMSYADIFDTTGIPVEKVKKYYSSAIRKLKNNKTLEKSFKNYLKEEKVLNKGKVGVVPEQIGIELADELLKIAI